MNVPRGVLLVDDDVLLTRALSRELALRGFRVATASSGEEALEAHGAEPYDAVLVDLHMPDMDGLSVIAQLRDTGCQAKLVLWSAHADVETAVRALRVGADDVLTKPLAALDLDAYLRTGSRARRGLGRESVAPDAAASSPILGDAPAIRAVREQVRTVARFRDLPVLITGETGTGKELVAQAVHAASGTAGPFLPVNCAAIPEPLFESELFGHDAGSFTGARGARAGLFESVGDGTLFLDEIGELPAVLQPKLLRAVETRSFRRVGGSRDLPFRARVISATHRPLVGADGALRSDLYYRLAGFTITTPPLRERTSDLDMLARHFLTDFAQRYEVEAYFSPRALEALHTYDWPGNVRELRAVVQQAAVLANDGRIGVAELTLALRDRQERTSETRLSTKSSGVVPALRVPEPLRDMERRTIQETWDESGHNLSAAARTLGLSRTTLRDRLRKYGLR